MRAAFRGFFSGVLPVWWGLLAAALLLGSPRPAEAQAPLRLAAPALVQPGQAFVVEVHAGATGSPVQDLFGVGFSLSFDAARLEYVGATFGGFLGADLVTFSRLEGAALELAVSRKQPAGGVSGAGLLAAATFRLKAGAAPTPALAFTLGAVAATNAAGAPLALSPSGASSAVGGCPFAAVAPTGRSGVLLGTVTAAGAPAAAADCLGAFDAAGVLVGKAALQILGGQARVSLTIYGDDPATMPDEGVAPGETFTLRLYQAAGGVVVPYGAALSGWQDAGGGALPAYNDPARPFAFTPAAVQTHPLERGWNLVSWRVAPANPAPADVFAAAPQVVSTMGFKQGYKTYQPGAPSNSLAAIEPGYGYWLRSADASTLSVAGAPSDAFLSIPLTSGWNLIGFTGAAPEAVEVALAPLGADVQYVLGFSRGYKSYRPSASAQQNSLTMLEPGKAYWLRTAAPRASFRFGAGAGKTHGDDPALAALAAETAARLQAAPNPEAMFLTGTLAGRPHAVVEVLDAEDRVVGVGRTDAQGEIGLTPVYGDDPTTPERDGAASGDPLRLRVGGAVLEAGLRYTGGLNVQEIGAVALGADAAEPPAAYTLEAAYPNPFNPEAQVRFSLAEAGVIRLVLYDVLGRRVRTLAAGPYPAGVHAARIDGAGLAGGVYVYRLEAAGRVLSRRVTLLK